MRALAISGLTLLMLSLFDCGDKDGGQIENPQPPECQFEDDGFFELLNLDMEVDFDSIRAEERPCRELDATLIEMPFTGATGYLILRDEQGNDYRFQPIYDMDWQKQLSGLQIGETCRFVISMVPPNHVMGMRICNSEGLLYLAATYAELRLPAFFQCDFGESSLEQNPYNLKRDPFKGTELEGLTYKQLSLSESGCRPRKKETGIGAIALITNLPVTFQYGDQFKTLYQSQEATFMTPKGDFLVHVLYSLNVEPQNYDNGGGGYSFYVRRLQE